MFHPISSHLIRANIISFHHFISLRLISSVLISFHFISSAGKLGEAGSQGATLCAQAQAGVSNLLYSSLLYSILRYSTLHYSTLLYSTLLYSTLLYSTLLSEHKKVCRSLLVSASRKSRWKRPVALKRDLLAHTQKESCCAEKRPAGTRACKPQHHHIELWGMRNQVRIRSLLVMV